MMNMGDDFSRQTSEPIKAKVDRSCPDCGEPLPDDPQPVEDICCQCNCLVTKVYDLASLAGKPGSELNALIIGKDQFILTDNEAIHTLHSNVLGVDLGKRVSLEDFQAATPSAEVALGTWVRRFGSRIENNYSILLESIKEIGLDPKDFPRPPRR